MKKLYNCLKISKAAFLVGVFGILFGFESKAIVDGTYALPGLPFTASITFDNAAQTYTINITGSTTSGYHGLGFASSSAGQMGGKYAMYMSNVASNFVLSEQTLIDWNLGTTLTAQAAVNSQNFATGDISISRAYTSTNGGFSFTTADTQLHYIGASGVTPGSYHGGVARHKGVINIHPAPPCNDPDVPTLSPVFGSICPGASDTIKIGASDTLNDATQWMLYTVTCGGTKVDSNATGIFAVSPTTTTIYYVRGEDGAGCIDESTIACGLIAVAINPIPVSNPTALVGCDSLSYNGRMYYTNTMDNDTAFGGAANGCDSITNQQITINVVDTSVTNASPMLTSNAIGATYQWIDCANGDTIVGETSVNYTAATDGSYKVIVTQNGCTDTSACISIAVTGIDNKIIFTNDVSIYPNPINNLLTIELNEFSKDTHITILSIEGKVVYTNSTVNIKKLYIDADIWSKGVYVVQVKSNQNNKTIKLIKQ